ncbi:MAG: RluA family pseudouridine synthase [Firmicutes bacterium]|nr:RluA family pseudouridine synthase [Bacillota bacterium]
MILEFTIDKEAGDRLDVILAELIEDTSRSYIQKLFESNKILVNGSPAKKNRKAEVGDNISVDFPEEKDKAPQPSDIPLDIYHEDDDLIVVNKARGMVVHPAQGHKDDTLVNAILFHVGGAMDAELTERCNKDRPGIVHRIDKDTSGLLVIAKSVRAFESLSEQFRDHTITRVYTALTHSGFKNDEGTIDVPIGRDPINRLKRKANGVEARHAVTHYCVLERIGNYTLIEARLETGRTHQIRVHMAYSGNPVVGDPLYGPRKDKLKADGQILHAGKLGFMHPDGSGYIEFEAPLPKYFLNVLEKARKLK